MDFNHSEDRRMLADSLGRYLAQHYPFEERQRISGSPEGWSRDHWRAFAELGMIGAMFGDADGGFGGDGFDLAALFETLGQALVVEPFLGTLMAGRVLARVGDQEALLAEAIAGTALLAFAHDEPQGRYGLADVALVAERDREGWRLTGNKAVVAHAETADWLVISGRMSGRFGEAGGIGLFLVKGGADGLAIAGYPTIDGGRSGELSLQSTPALLLSEAGADLVEDVVATGLVALCWEAVGIMDILKADTLEYLRTRRQFGVPIGKFQALQHRMADVALEIEQARSAAIRAAEGLAQDRAARERAVSAAKVTIGRVGTLVAEEAIQMHGGIGMTWELPLAHFAKRLVMIDHQLGDEDHHLAHFIALSRHFAEAP